MMHLFTALWQYRGFVRDTVKREFQLKYRNSMLGVVWTVLNPLAMILVYTLVFSRIMQARLPDIDGTFAYSIYLCAGLLTWGLFAEITTRCQNIFLENANLLKKVAFPRMTLPVIVVVSALLNFSIIFSIFLVFLLVVGTFPGIMILALLPLLLVQILFSAGLGILLGVLNVFFRDVGQFFAVVLQFWFWFTPIVYPAGILPEHLQQLLVFNPMATLIAAYQQILVYGRMPDWYSLAPVLVTALGICLLALLTFRKRVGDIVDEI